MTLNCIHIFVVTGSFLYWCVMWPASHRFFIHSCIYLWILYHILLSNVSSTFLNSLSVLMCRKAVNQSCLLWTLLYIHVAFVRAIYIVNIADYVYVLLQCNYFVLIKWKNKSYVQFGCMDYNFSSCVVYCMIVLQICTEQLFYIVSVFVVACFIKNWVSN